MFICVPLVFVCVHLCLLVWCFRLDLLLEADGGNPSLKTTTLSELEFLNKLCDIWRIRNKNTKRYTYRQRTPFIQRRLDYIFVSSDLQDCVKTIDVIPSVNTDHSAVYLQIRVLNENRRKFILEVQ